MRLFPILHWAHRRPGDARAAPGARGVSGAAAWVGAATYAFSGVLVSEVFYLPIAPAAALHPWVLWAVVRPASSFGRKAVLLGVVYGVLFLVGDVVAVVIALLASSLWIGLERGPSAPAPRVWRASAAASRSPSSSRRRRSSRRRCWSRRRERAVMGIPLKEVFRFTLSPWRLLELVVPYPFGDTGPPTTPGPGARACGAAFSSASTAVPLPSWDWQPCRRSRLRGARFVRALFVAGALLAMSGILVPAAWGNRRSADPAPVSGEVFRGAGPRRSPLAAGLAFDRIRRDGWAPRWPLGAGVVLALVAAGASLLPGRAGSAAVRALGASPDLAARCRPAAAGRARGSRFALDGDADRPGARTRSRREAAGSLRAAAHGDPHRRNPADRAHRERGEHLRSDGVCAVDRAARPARGLPHGRQRVVRSGLAHGDRGGGSRSVPDGLGAAQLGFPHARALGQGNGLQRGSGSGRLLAPGEPAPVSALAAGRPEGATFFAALALRFARALPRSDAPSRFSPVRGRCPPAVGRESGRASSRSPAGALARRARRAFRARGDAAPRGRRARPRDRAARVGNGRGPER